MSRPIGSFRQSGYTLIELVVVLLVLGVTMSLVIPRLSVPDNQALLEQHSRNIQILVRSIEDDSAILGRIIGLMVKDNTLQIMQLKKGVWEKRPADSTLRHYDFNPPFEVSIDVGQPLFQNEEKNSNPLPAMILPDGQSTPFEITITNTQTEKSVIISHDPNDLAMAH